ncbi:MAG: hypothetical protein AB7F43_15020 [Bacteriovoracia bacterium]
MLKRTFGVLLFISLSLSNFCFSQDTSGTTPVADPLNAVMTATIRSPNLGSASRTESSKIINLNVFIEGGKDYPIEASGGTPPYLFQLSGSGSITNIDKDAGSATFRTPTKAGSSTIAIRDSSVPAAKAKFVINYKDAAPVTPTSPPPPTSSSGGSSKTCSKVATVTKVNMRCDTSRSLPADYNANGLCQAGVSMGGGPAGQTQIVMGDVRCGSGMHIENGAVACAAADTPIPSTSDPNAWSPSATGGGSSIGTYCSLKSNGSSGNKYYSPGEDFYIMFRGDCCM